MTQSEVRSIALFFYLAFLDDQKALEAAAQACALHQKRVKKDPQLKSAVALVAATADVWNKYKVRISRGRPNTTVESGWLIPPQVDMGPWREFQKTAASEELATVIWSKVLKLSDADISAGLGITQGTIRYRLGRSLRKLGGMCAR